MKLVIKDKNSKRKQIETHSVLNTDAYDKRRLNQIIGISKSLKKLKDHASMPKFDDLLGDIWASLYKMKPEIMEEIPNDLQANKTMMERIMNEETFHHNREFTRLDDLSSAIGTVKFGEKTLEWIEEQK